VLPALEAGRRGRDRAPDAVLEWPEELEPILDDATNEPSAVEKWQLRPGERIPFWCWRAGDEPKVLPPPLDLARHRWRLEF